MKNYFTYIYKELLLWRDDEIRVGNMDKARKLQGISKKYKYGFYVDSR